MSFFTRTVSSDDLEDTIATWQRSVSILLYISLIAHGFEVFLTNVGVLEGLIPVLQVIAAIAALVFFLAECLILPPVGVLIMTVVSALLSWVVPYFVAFLVRSLIESILFMAIGGIIMALSVGLVVIVVNGVVVGAVIVPLVVTPFLAASGAMGITVLTGAGTAAAVDAGVQQIRPADLVRPRRVLINLLLLLVLVWPALTWTGIFQGVFALKPVQRAQQQHLSFSEENTSDIYRLYFEPQENYIPSSIKHLTFDEGFYHNFIYPGRNTFAQGATPSASTDTCIAFCLNGMVYLTDIQANELYHATAYNAAREDAIVMVDKEAFLFCHNRIALLGPDGRYLWENTNWTSDFERLSEKKQYEQLYAILEAQNDGQSGAIPIEDVAIVAYAQRNGLLLYYDTASHSAYFGQKNKTGEITILRQSAPETREEITSFTPQCDSDNLPYTMLNTEVLAYINGNRIIFQGVADEWDCVHYENKIHDGKTHPFVSFHTLHDADGNEYFAYQDSEDIICVERLGSPVIEAKFDASRYDAVYSVGNYIYGIVYDSDNLLNSFTYINDRQDGDTSTSVWTENWGWDRIHLHSGLWDKEEEAETAPPVEKTFSERYSIPELRTSVRQIGLYKDNVVSPSQYAYYKGPADNFYFRFPRIVYEEVDYTFIEDGAEVLLHYSSHNDTVDRTTTPLSGEEAENAPDGSKVQIHLYCNNDPSSLTVTLRPNADGTDHKTLLSELQKRAEAEMVNVKRVRSGYADQECTASTFYLTGNTADGTGMICTRLCWVDGEHIMEMELRMPKATDNEDKAHKDFYAKAMYACCGFGSNTEPPVWWKFKKSYGL